MPKYFPDLPTDSKIDTNKQSISIVGGLYPDIRPYTHLIGVHVSPVSTPYRGFPRF